MSVGIHNYTDSNDELSPTYCWNVAEKSKYQKLKFKKYEKYLLKHFSEEVLNHTIHDYFYYIYDLIVFKVFVINGYNSFETVKYAYAPKFNKIIIKNKIENL